MLLSTRTLAHASAALVVACATSSPGTGDSVAISPRVPATERPATPAASAARPDSTRPVSTPAQSPFSRLLTQRTSGFDEPAELAIRDQAALESAWSRLFNQVQGNPPPAVDFGQETVIVVALGGRGSGGHAVHVDAIDRSGDGAVVRYTASGPAPGCATTQSLTSPVDVVRTPRIAGTVRFQRHDAVQPC
jgi:hypothetical protein